MRDRNPSNNANWKLICSVCGAEFAETEQIDLAQGHAQQEHPELEHPSFNLMWVGIGPKPKKDGAPRHGPRRRR